MEMRGRRYKEGEGGEQGKRRGMERRQRGSGS